MSSTTVEKTPEANERMRILIVDDELVIRRSLRLILEPKYEVLEAASIAESLALFDQRKPDLITLDIYLPDIDGMKGLQQFRQRSETIPIILVSGHATFELAQEALRLGATDYLTKPFTATGLLDIVRSCLVKARLKEDFAQDSTESSPTLKLRLPLENLQDNKFLSPQHRTHFLAFAQNALAHKKRTFETIAIHELVETIKLQFEALHLKEDVTCTVPPADQKVHLDCDMYLLGGALANLVFACLKETRNSPSPFVLEFACSGGKLRILYKKVGAQLPGEILTRFKDWHPHPSVPLDANTAMLILAENALKEHQGEFSLSPSSADGSLLEISLPLKQSARH